MRVLSLLSFERASFSRVKAGVRRTRVGARSWTFFSFGSTSVGVAVVGI
jgi:hypothetical protein